MRQQLTNTVLFLGLCIPSIASASDHPAYTVDRVDVDSAEGLMPLAIGDGGIVPLYTMTLPDPTQPRRAFAYDHGSIVPIIAPPGMTFLGTSANGSGQMAGIIIPSSFDIPAHPTAASYRDGVASALPAPPGLTLGYTAVIGMNDRGDMVGWWQDDAGNAEAILWTASGQTVRLDADQPGISFAHAVNERGTVVGWVTSLEGVTDLVVWRDGTMTRIEGIPGVGILPLLNDRDQVLLPSSGWWGDDAGP